MNVWLTGSTCEISRRSAITRAAMQSLENQIWRSRLAISTKLRLYNTCILPIFLYGSDCWAIFKTHARKIDALDQCMVYAYAAWHQMVPICTEWWCTKANEATQTHCYNPVTPAYRVLAYYAHQEDPVNLASGGLEKTTRSSPHHVAQYRPTGSETTPPCAPWSSRFGSEPPSVEDDVDVWRYAILRVACQKRRRRVWLEQTTSCVNLCLFSTL